MLLKHRPPGIDSASVQVRPGLEHLERKSIAVLRWLNANKVDFIVVGPVAHAIRGDVTARGPVAIVPAPYGRNYDRLTRALVAEHAGLRSERGLGGGGDRSDSVAVKLTADKLARGRRWMLRFGEYDLDIEGAGTRAAGARETVSGRSASASASASPPAGGETARAPRYQELLYEANRFELADGVTVEVASPEDLEHFSHVRRTGTAPEFVVTRNVTGEPPAEPEADEVADGEAEATAMPESTVPPEASAEPDAESTDQTQA
ncbi:MAG TPA: hypothetical protein VHX62_13965 [Solirubrobacteraceae bacterium]|jgi:hypothetical protein|nr:hypothetical protein [Solirubrobacteraceae bacterium]